MSASAALTIDALLAAISSAGVLTADELLAAQSVFPDGRWPQEAAQVIEGLHRAGKLTRFQGQMLYAGRGASLLLGEYLLLDKLGAGGMGQVYKARHRRMKREVALKVLPPAVQKDPALIARFQREVEAAAKLSHPNVVVAHDAGESRGVHYLVTEYVPGSDLGAFIKEKGPLPAAWAVELIYQAALGLDYAHRQGVIHRDIKPSNFLLSHDGVVKVADLGLARVLEADDSATPKPADGLTNTGAVMGTIDYMAPEQAVDTHTADARSDIYSLGCTLHFLLTGRPPFPTGTVVQKILAHREQPPPVLMAGELTQLQTTTAVIELDSLNHIFQTMLAKSPTARYQTMAEVLKALEPLRQGLSTEDLGREFAGPKVQSVPATAATPTDAGTDANAPTFVPGGRVSGPTPVLPTIVVGDSAVAPHVRQAAKPITTRRGWIWPAAIVGVAGVMGLIAWLAKPPHLAPRLPTGGEDVATAPDAATATKQPSPKKLSNLPPAPALDPALIPAEERFDWQPKELLAVLGSSARKHWDRINDLEYSESWNVLLSSSDDGFVTAWDANDLKRVSSLKFRPRREPGREFVVQGHSIAPDPHRGCVWVYAQDQTVRRLELQNGQLVETEWWPTSKFISSMQISPRDHLLATIDGRDLKFLNVDQVPPKVVWETTISSEGGGGLCFLSEGQSVATWGRGDKPRVWNLQGLNQGEVPNELPIQLRLQIHSNVNDNDLAFDPRRQELLINRGGAIELCRRESPDGWKSVEELPGNYTLSSASPDGRWLVTEDQNARIEIFDRSSADWRGTRFQIALEDARALAFRPDSQRLVLGHGRGGIQQWDTSQYPPKLLTEDPSGRHAIDLKFSPDGRNLLACGWDSGVTLWSLIDGHYQRRQAWAGIGPSRGGAWSADGKWFAFCDHGGAWNRQTLKCVSTETLDLTVIPVPDERGIWLSTCTLAPNGLRAATAGDAVHIYERTATDKPWRFTHRLAIDYYVHSLAFSPDSTQLAVHMLGQTISDSGSLQHPGMGLVIWDFRTTPPRERAILAYASLNVPPNFGNTLAWSSDGKTLWRHQHVHGGGRAILRFDMSIDQPRQSGRIELPAQGLSLSPDGRHMAAADGEQIYIASTDPTYLVHTYQLQRQVHDVDWHPSGEFLATANGDGTIYLLKIPESLRAE